MKRKIFLIIALFVFLPLTNVYAEDDCTSTNISGQASSYKTTNTDGGCTWVCWWDHTIGLRFRIYKYDGNSYQALGNGVDVWGFSSAGRVYMSNARYSNPDNVALNLKTASNCATKQTTGLMSLEADEYDDHKIYIESSLNTHFDNGTVNEYILKSDRTGGWLYSNLYSKLKANTPTKDAEIKRLWGVEASELRKNGENIYIVVEVLVKVYAKDSTISGFKDDNFYFGTVSEFAPTLGYSSTYRALGIESSTIGKMVPGLIKKKDLSELPSSFAAYGDDNQENKKAACNNAYGMAIYHLTTDCEDCGKSCDSQCGNYIKGTSERRACAIEYCKLEEPGEANCVSSCSDLPVPDTGCPTPSCETKNNFDNDANSNGPECSGTTTLTSKVCYDDKTEIEIAGENSSDLTREELDIIYYKIECNETLKIANMSNEVKVYQFKDRAADLHLGLSASFSKTCKLQFKYKGTNGYVWKDADNNDTDSLIKNDIALYKSYYNKYVGTNGSLADQYKKAYLDLEKTYTRAYARLEYVAALDTSSVEAGSKFEVVNNSLTDSVTIDIDLKPIYCEPTDSKVEDKKGNSLKCIVTKEEVYIQEDNSVICGNDGTADVVVNRNKGESSYDYTVHYGSESTWISSYGDPDEVYYGGEGKEKCLTAAEAFNGYCTEIADTYRFEPFDISVSSTTEAKVTSGDIVIKLENYGSCDGQIDFRCHVKYLLIDGKACSKCMDYNPTSQEYINCYKANCSCDVICGSNVSCRAQYCPIECEGCEVGYIDMESTPEICDDCVEKCEEKFPTSGNGGTNENLSSNIVCRYDCCNKDCDINNDTCRFDCCKSKCNDLENKNLLGYMGYKATQSMTALEVCYNSCKCPNGNCGNDYYYRTINQNEPFPKREPGANWFNKVDYITKSGDSNGRYYDATNGRNDSYEYRITLSADDIRKIRNDNKINTTYTEKKSSTTMYNLDDEKVYCSYMLHDYLKNDLNINVEAGADEKFGSGCKYKG